MLDLMVSNGLTRATDEVVEIAFNHILSSSNDLEQKLSLGEVNELHKPFTDATRSFITRMGIKEHNPKEGAMFFNGKLLEYSEEKVKLLLFSMCQTTSSQPTTLCSHGLIL